MKRQILTATAILSVNLWQSTPLVRAETWNAMDWIDGEIQATTPDWDQKLGINWTRVSCRVGSRLDPQKCVDFIKGASSSPAMRYFLYIPVDTATIQANALRYSALSARVPQIESVGIDDFFSRYYDWYRQMPDAPRFVATVIDNLKRHNRKLKFGITLYEDELDRGHAYIDDAHLPAWVKAKFDYIHLFLHYRKNGPRFADYVQRTQAYFPNAKVIAGVYSMDRIDYISCAQGDPTREPCTEAEELGLFKDTLGIQVKLMRDGKVAGLELFPGYFGAEDQLEYGSGNSYYADQRVGHNRSCNNPDRCLRVTKAMRDLISKAHESYRLSPL